MSFTPFGMFFNHYVVTFLFNFIFLFIFVFVQVDDSIKSGTLISPISERTQLIVLPL